MLTLPITCWVIALQAGVTLRRESLGQTLAGLQEMLVYGLKGMAAYTHHAGRCQVLMPEAQPPSWMQCL